MADGFLSVYFLLHISEIVGVKEIAYRYFKPVAKFFDCDNADIFCTVIDNIAYS